MWATRRTHVAFPGNTVISRISKVWVQLERFLFKLQHEYILWVWVSKKNSCFIRLDRGTGPYNLPHSRQHPASCKARIHRGGKRHTEEGERPQWNTPQAELGVKWAHQQPITMGFVALEKRQNKFPFCSEVVMMDTSFFCYFFPAQHLLLGYEDKGRDNKGIINMRDLGNWEFEVYWLLSFCFLFFSLEVKSIVSLLGSLA